MIEWMSFPTARPCLLRENGDTISLDNAPADPAGARVLVLSRALCWFELYRRPPGLSRAEMGRAARLHAEAHAPCPGADFALFRNAAGVGIWYWDRAQVQALLRERWRYAPQHIVPESAIQSPGEGWRQVKTADGYEAQYWSSHALVATLWRRRPFTQAQWASFVTSVPHAAHTGAVELPSPVAAAAQSQSGLARGRIHASWGWSALERGAIAAAFAAALVAMFFQGQSLNHESAMSAQAATLAKLDAENSGKGASDVASRDLAMVRAFAALTSNPDHVLAATDALHIFSTYNVTVSGWRVDRDGFQADVADAEVATLPELAAALEAEPRLANVSPQRDPVTQSTRFTIDVPPFRKNARKGDRR